MVEKEVRDLAKIYINFFHKYSPKHFRLSTLEKSRWLKYFQRVINEFSKREGWDPYVFIACQFEKNGKIYPFKLVGEKAWETFIEYKHRFSRKDYKAIAQDLLSTFNTVKVSGKSFIDFLKDKHTEFFIKTGKIDYKLFLFYKPFYKIFNVKELDKKWKVWYILIRKNEKIFNKMKEIFGEEIMFNIYGDNLTQLEEIYSKIKKCNKCSLYKNRTNPVLYRGNPKAKILLVGEAPGQKEDETGIPFVGRSGKLLDTILEEIGLKDYYISNIIRCRPPGNRKPFYDEIIVCAPYLMSEISIIKPKLIITLGRTAGDWFLKEYTINEYNREEKVLPLYHPSYLLRNRKEIEPFKLALKNTLKEVEF